MMAEQDVDIDRERPVLVGCAHQALNAVSCGPCERCRKPVWGSVWQRQKVREIDARFEHLPIVRGGKRRSRIGLLCWECARDLGVRIRGRADKEGLTHV